MYFELHNNVIMIMTLKFDLVGARYVSTYLFGTYIL